MLRVEDLTKSFGPITVLDGVSEHFQAGSIHGLIGANGAGKSTLIKIVSGLQPGSFGKVVLDGRATAFASPQDAYSAGIRTLQQETDVNLFTSLTVVENIVLRTRNRGGFRRLIRHGDLARARERLALVGGGDIPLRKIVGDLPLAKRQQVALASALDEQARVLILDEPTAALDRKSAKRLLEVIRSIRDHGAAIILVTHHLPEIVEVADRVTVLREGRVADRFEMPPAREPGAILPRIIASMTGNSAAEPRAGEACATPVSTATAGARLQVENLVADSIINVSFAVEAGQVVTLTGLVGSGTSAVLQCIYGLRRAGGGRLRLDGEMLPWSDPSRMANRGIGMVPDDRQHLGLHLQHSIVWNSTLPVLSRFSGPFGFLAESRLIRATQAVSKRVNLVASALSLPVAALSGGNQQKVVIAKWLTTPRKLLLLDEPTRGVDVGTRQQIYRLLRDLARQEGLAVLCSTYDFNEAIHLSDRILVMKRGEIVAERRAGEATEESLMDLAMGGVQ
jgi:ABC-type sugar transport system ATPase subunit